MCISFPSSFHIHWESKIRKKVEKDKDYHYTKWPLLLDQIIRSFFFLLSPSQNFYHYYYHNYFFLSFSLLGDFFSGSIIKLCYHKLLFTSFLMSLLLALWILYDKLSLWYTWVSFYLKVSCLFCNKLVLISHYRFSVLVHLNGVQIV